MRPVFSFTVCEADIQNHPFLSRGEGRMNCKFLKWSDQLCIGVAPLDEGHKELVDLYNRIAWACENDPDKNTVCERLLSFVIYAKHHFKEEEAYMLSIHYNDYVQHKSEHDRVLQDAEDFIDNLSGSMAMLDGQAIVKYFKYWLLRHILTRDADLRRFADQSVAEGQEG
jgi:hemerythrin